MKHTVFTGAGAAIITPMKKDGSVHYQTLETLIKFYLKNQIDAIVVAGTTGEASTLLPHEYEELVGFAVKTVAGKVPVIAGAGGNSTAHAIALSKVAYKAGVDGLLQVTPYYNKTSQTGLIAHFTAIADATPLPIILYNVPSRTGMTIHPETYQTLSHHPHIVATKEASGDFSAISKTIALCGDSLDVYSGNDDQIVPLLSLGGKGVISVLADVMPQEAHNICAYFFQGEIAKSSALQLKLLSLIDVLFSDVNPIPVKTALNIMGFDCGSCRLPLVNMSPDKLELLAQTMARYGLVKEDNRQ